MLLFVVWWFSVLLNIIILRDSTKSRNELCQFYNTGILHTHKHTHEVRGEELADGV